MKYRGLLINPNSSDATSQMMVNIINKILPDHIHFDVITARNTPLFINSEEALKLAQEEVISLAQKHYLNYDGIIIGAYGDPGLRELRAQLDIPMTGLFEASFLEAKKLKRKFAVVTVTPHLLAYLSQQAEQLGTDNNFLGFYCTEQFTAEALQQSDLLYAAVVKWTQLAVTEGADTIIVGGGPLGQLAIEMRKEFDYSVIAPLESAVKKLIQAINTSV
ncbi:aspartate/glutamate racemase family protein [Acinetobacter puyangensis]|uniref:aspartate/glutamate racemase family protein n=1 Tax=Acinetobacter puyangensis TaxID=1096779 RepID=UPI003A4DB6B2